MQVGYCCNVHPGTTLDEVRENLLKYSVQVKRRVSGTEPMPIGLWFSSTAARELSETNRRVEFRRLLDQVGLVAHTLNGFPFGDFHQPVVKHDVYQPTWAERSRLDYTLDLIDILHDLLPNDECGTISTLPLGWPPDLNPGPDQGFFRACANNLKQLAKRLDCLFEATGRRIMVCLEPEPGCVLDSASDIGQFFADYLCEDGDPAEERVRRFLGVCHDVCHSAVVFEGQSQAMKSYQQAKIHVGKVQISSAIELNFDDLPRDQQDSARNELKLFAEPRYLHQTVWQRGDDRIFFEDLGKGLLAVEKWQSSNPNSPLSGALRVHFHVPIFADRLGLLLTTQPEIQQCLRAMSDTGSQPCHFEIETYAWNVLPVPWQPSSLVEGITQELDWLKSQMC
jgi:hypothetical protein